MTVARTILDQLGGSMFITMTGAKNLVDHGSALSFKLGRGAKNKATHCKITLDPTDTYTVEFMRYNGRSFEMKSMSSDSQIYCDTLRQAFTERTGFYCTMGQR